MPVKISGRTRLSKKLRAALPDARSNSAKEIKRNIVKIIVDKIKSGNSPVSGQNKYKGYSKAYKKSSGKSNPVDLTATGKMLGDMRAVQKNNGSVIIDFRSNEQNLVASYHNNPSSNSNMPKRKILPRRNEKFKQDIMDKILKIVRAAVKKAFK